MDAETAPPPSAARHLQLDSPMRPQVIKFCYKKRSTGHSRNDKDNSSQDPKIQFPSSPLSRQSLSTPVIPIYYAGGFYEIDYEKLPPRTPIHLKSIRVVKVSEYTSLDITVSFPSLLALRSFFSSFPLPSAGPELVEHELEGEMHWDSFWPVNPCHYDFSASSHPATLPDALSSPEAPPAQPKASGVRRRVRYIGRHRDGSSAASIGGYETEASVKEQPPAPEDKRSSISGKRKQDGAKTSKDKSSNERKKRNKTYKIPLKNSSVLFMIILLLSIPFANGENCDPKSLSNKLATSCIKGPNIKTLQCCLPLLTAIDDESGDIKCLCTLSKEPKLTHAGFNYLELINLYSTCGGMNEDLAQQATCGGGNPPPPTSTPPPAHVLSPTPVIPPHEISSSAPAPPTPLFPQAPAIPEHEVASSAPPPPSYTIVDFPSFNPVPPDFPTNMAIRTGEALSPILLYYITDYFAPWIIQALKNALIWLFQVIAAALMWLYGASVGANRRGLGPAAVQRDTELVAPPTEVETGGVPPITTLPMDVP